METELETGCKQYTEVPRIWKTEVGTKSTPEAAEPTKQHSHFLYSLSKGIETKMFLTFWWN